MTSVDESDRGAAVWERQRRSRAEAQETIWFAQAILWLPLLTQSILLGVMLFAIAFRGLDVRASWPTSPWRGLLSLLFPVLYGLAGWWVGARDRRGVWLGIALFGWSLANALVYGHLLSYRAGYALVGLGLVVRAGRALGIPQLRP